MALEPKGRSEMPDVTITITEYERDQLYVLLEDALESLRVDGSWGEIERMQAIEKTLLLQKKLEKEEEGTWTVAEEIAKAQGTHKDSPGHGYSVLTAKQP
jgi:hypothetical protein